jgi:hypothetical protein
VRHASIGGPEHRAEGRQPGHARRGAFVTEWRGITPVAGSDWSKIAWGKGTGLSIRESGWVNGSGPAAKTKGF